MLIALLGACGSSETAAPSKLVPKDSAVYGEFTLDPKGDQEQAVRDVAERFPGGEDLNEQIDRSLGEALREEGVDYAKEIEPYLGEEAVFFISGVREGDADGAVVIEVTDEDKARSAIEKLVRSGSQDKPRERSYKGNDYLLDDEEAAGVVDEHAVIGTEAGFRAAVDTSDESADTIEDSDRVRESLDRLPEDALLSVYVDGKRLVSSLGPEGAIIAPFLEVFDEPYVFGVSAESDAVVLDSTLPASLTAFAAPLFFGSGTEAVGELPADSWYAVGQPELGKTLQSLVRLFAGAVGGQEQLEGQVRSATGLDLNEDILAWMGDLGGFARGSSLEELGAGVVIDSKDPQVSRRSLAALARVARREAEPGVRVGRLTLPGGGDGFTVRAPELPAPVHVAQRGRRVAVALGDEAAEDLLEPSQMLGDDGDFKAAAGRLGDGFEVANFLDVAPVIELAEAEGASSNPDYLKAKPYLEPFVRVVAGTKKDGDVVLSRTRVELR